MENKKINVLVSPAHYLIDEYQGGSEYLWAYKLLDSISKYPSISLNAITGYSMIRNKNKNLKIYEVYRKRFLNLSIPNRFKFIFQNFNKAKSILKNKDIHLIHHMFPFGFKQTFNLLALLNYTKDIPFIVGPLQSPLHFKTIDEKGKSNRDLKQKNSKLGYIVPQIMLNTVSPVLAYLSKKTLQKADALICINNKTKELYSDMVDSKKIVVIPPGIDISKHKFINRKKRNIVEILIVGYLVKRKGIELIIRVIATIVKTNPNVRVRIVGDGPEKENLQNLTKQLNIEKYVIFQGFIPNTKINGYYENADIFCFASYSEGFATVCLEAMASGLPIISTDVGGFNDIIIDSKNGYIIKDRDSLEFKKKLLTLVDGRDLRIRIGKNARKIIERKYDWEIIAKQYYEIYKRVFEDQIGGGASLNW